MAPVPEQDRGNTACSVPNKRRSMACVSSIIAMKSGLR